MILTESNKRLKIAKNLIEKLNIFKILEHHGNPLLIGSVAQGVVWNRDIDIVIETNNMKISSQNALCEFVENEEFNKIQYGNFIKFPRENRPKGYIINIFICDYENNPWEFEIWFLNDIQHYKDELLHLKNRTTIEKQNLIIQKSLRNP